MRIPLQAAIALILLTLGVDVYLYRSIRRRHGARSGVAIAYSATSLICWILLAVILLMPRRSADGDIQSIMWMLYSYLTIYIPKTIIVIFSAIGTIPALFRKRRWRTGLYAGIPIAVLVFSVMWYGATFGRSALQVTNVTVVSPKLPPAFDGYRIAQFSDAHVGTWGNDTAFVAAMVDSINALHPDLIVFTGDIVNRRTDEIKPFTRILSRLHAPDGVISILGNHDYGDYITWDTPEQKAENMRQMYQEQKGMKWTMLNNDHLFIRHGLDSIAVIGVENWGEPPFATYGDLDKAYPAKDSLHNLSDRNFKLLLSHNPEHWNRHVSHETNIDLTLSGHTHAMQFMIQIGDWKWSPSQYIYEQWSGLHQRATKDGEPVMLYVNIGSGEVGMPYRIGAKSEITLITLKR